MELEAPQRIAPHPFENLTNRSKLIPPGAIEALTALGPQIDEAGLGERPQVQRDGTERDVGHRRVDRAGVQLLAPEQTQDLAAARRGDG